MGKKKDVTNKGENVIKAAYVIVPASAVGSVLAAGLGHPEVAATILGVTGAGVGVGSVGLLLKKPLTERIIRKKDKRLSRKLKKVM